MSSISNAAEVGSLAWRAARAPRPRLEPRWGNRQGSRARKIGAAGRKGSL